MYKILVLSDAHGSTEKPLKAYELEKPQCVVFLGDCVSDYLKICDKFVGCDQYVVAGNCDGGASCGFAEKIVTDICGKRFYLTHGHRENVKAGYIMLCMSAFENEADVALFGHTHATCKNVFNGLELLNPGSISCGDYGVVELEESADGGKTIVKTFVKSVYQ